MTSVNALMCLIIELRDICKQLLAAKVEHGISSDLTQDLVEKLLPPTSGFFFGSTAVDEYFFQDLEDTLDILKDVEANKGDYYYQASW